MIKTIDRYIIKEIFDPFLFGLGAFTAILSASMILFDLVRAVVVRGMPLLIRGTGIRLQAARDRGIYFPDGDSACSSPLFRAAFLAERDSRFQSGRDKPLPHSDAGARFRIRRQSGDAALLRGGGAEGERGRDKPDDGIPGAQIRSRYRRTFLSLR